MPPSITVRRPTRSDSALAGKAVSAPAVDATVATRPIVAVE
jgi:hypothetical protein